MIDLDRVALIGPILAEVLLGFRRDDQAQWVASRLRLTHYIELSTADWETAASLGRRLSAAGHKLPLTDLVLAVVSQRVGAAVYSTVPGFRRGPRSEASRAAVENTSGWNATGLPWNGTFVSTPTCRNGVRCVLIPWFLSSLASGCVSRIFSTVASLALRPRPSGLPPKL